MKKAFGLILKFIAENYKPEMSVEAIKAFEIKVESVCDELKYPKAEKDHEKKKNKSSLPKRHPAKKQSQSPESRYKHVRIQSLFPDELQTIKIG